MVDAGKFDRRIILQTRTVARGAAGGTAETWANTASLWAQKVETSGSEARRAGMLRADTNLLLRIRYRAGVNEQQRVYVDGRYYEITQVSEDISTGAARRETQFLQCRYVEGSAS